MIMITIHGLGATGGVGRRVVEELRRKGVPVRGMVSRVLHFVCDSQPTCCLRACCVFYFVVQVSTSLGVVHRDFGSNVSTQLSNTSVHPPQPWPLLISINTSTPELCTSKYFVFFLGPIRP